MVSFAVVRPASSLNGNVVPVYRGQQATTDRPLVFRTRTVRQCSAEVRRVFDESVETHARVFAWEDKFRRLLLRFERLSPVHYAFKTLAYTMINLRHYG
jgi:hypothetical protein